MTRNRVELTGFVSKVYKKDNFSIVRISFKSGERYNYVNIHCAGRDKEVCDSLGDDDIIYVDGSLCIDEKNDGETKDKYIYVFSKDLIKLGKFEGKRSEKPEKVEKPKEDNEKAPF